MNSARLIEAGHSPAPPWRAASVRWLVGAGALVLLVAATPPTAASHEAPGTPSAPEQRLQPEEPVRAGSAGWGVISDMRRIEARDGVPSSYILTVRMRDGSVRESSGPGAGRWKVGERILLIG